MCRGCPCRASCWTSSSIQGAGLTCEWAQLWTSMWGLPNFVCQSHWCQMAGACRRWSTCWFFFMVVIKFITLQIKYFKSRYCYHLAPKAFSRSLRPWCLVPLWSMDLWRSQSLGLWDWVHIVSGIHMSDPKIVFRTFTLLTYMCMRVFLIFTHRHFYIYIYWASCCSGNTVDHHPFIHHDST